MSRGVAAPTAAFFAIPLEHLEPATVVGFDLFLRHGEADPVLYRARDLEFTPGLRERLIQNGVTHVWAPVEQASAYRAYLEARVRGTSPAAPPSHTELELESILADQSRPLRPRCSSLIGASRAVVRAALADLNTPGLSLRIQRVAEATARFLLAEPQAYPTLVALMELDLDTYNHSTHTALYTTELARAVGMTDPRDLTAIGRAALLHDVGKAGLPVEVLRRERPLTAEERRSVDAHTTRGVQLVRDAGLADSVILDVCANHHERCDGSGHPRRIGRDDISVQSRIVAIADVFDNLTSASARRPALSGFQALWRMKRHMTGQFDADLLDAFIETLVAPAARR